MAWLESVGGIEEYEDVTLDAFLWLGRESQQIFASRQEFDRLRSKVGKGPVLATARDRGPDAALTTIDPLTFPHAATGFDLTAHAQTEQGLPFACADCHPDSLTVFELVLCTDCHRELDPAYTDAHLLDFGTECLACHDGVDRYTNFDHSRTDFVIDGAHSEPACRDCHIEARTVADLQNTPAECAACHLEQDAQ